LSGVWFELRFKKFRPEDASASPPQGKTQIGLASAGQTAKKCHSDEGGIFNLEMQESAPQSKALWAKVDICIGFIQKKKLMNIYFKMIAPQEE
ncbi:MAG: hypothetical protein HC880_20680, partial [Bacteroidia bacterium]|nr:hypothetical protein [Bacteroidia bacterium]